MEVKFPEEIDFLKVIPPELDTSKEINKILDFMLYTIEKDYGFEGLGIQLVDYEKNKIKFYKLHIPSVDPEIVKKVEAIESPLSPEGGISALIVQQNLIFYIKNLQGVDFSLYPMAKIDREVLLTLKHITHIIIPISFDYKVVALFQLSSFTKPIILEQKEIEKLKNICQSVGSIVYKTLHFKKIYEENQQLMIDTMKMKQARDNLLAGISHELKTPLNAVIGFSDYLSKTKKAELPKIHEIAKTINKNGHYLLSIIQEVIELYKLNSGKIKIDFREIPLQDIVGEAVASLTTLAVQRKQKIKTQVEKIKVLTDFKRLSEILYNLISNAIKYTPEQGKIEIKAYQDTGRFFISVKDNGIGMDEEDLSSVFIPFKRGKSASYEQAEGSGLGLFMTNELVKLLGGEITITSKPKIGSEFTVSFPLQ